MRNYYIYNMIEKTVIELTYDQAMTYDELEYLEINVEDDHNDGGVVTTDNEFGYIVVDAATPEYVKLVLDHEIGHLVTGYRREDGGWHHGSEVEADAHAAEVNGLDRVLTLLHDTCGQIEALPDDSWKTTALKQLRQRIRKLKHVFKYKK